MSNLYKNPLTPEQLNGAQSVSRTETFGTNFSVLGIGGFMEVYNISDLNFTIPPATTGPIELSGNTIPISFLKGSGPPFSYDVLTLGSDNISSGRRRLGMLVYVYETNQVYQYSINNYDSLWNSATAATNTVVISDFGTTVNNSTPEGQSFIDSWTSSTIEGISGITRSTATWKKYYGNDLSITGGTYNAFTSTLNLVNITGGTVPITGIGGGGGGGTTITGGTFNSNTGTLSLNSSAGTITVTGFTDYYVTGGTYSSGVLTLRNNSGGTFNVNGFYTGATDVFVTGGTFNGTQILFTNNTGGTFTVTGFTSGSSSLQYFISGSTPTGVTINSGDRWFDTNTGIEVVYINDGNSNQWVQPNAGGSFIGDYLPLSGGTLTGGLTANTISATTYQNLPGSSSSNCQTTFYVTNISGCSPVNMLTEVKMLSGLTVTGAGYFTGTVTASTISATTYQNYPTNFTSGLTATTISATTYLNLPTDVRTTGGTYSNNIFTFTNNTGGTYSVLFNTVTGLTVNGILTVTGNTSLQALTATTISANTYSNLPTDIRTTGASYSNNTFTFTNNTGGTYSVLFNTVTGLTVNGILTITGNTSAQGLTATTISATTYQNIPIKYYAEFSASPTNSPIVLSAGSISIGDGAESRSTYMLSFGQNSGRNATGTTYSNFIGVNAGYDASGSSYSNFVGSGAGYGAINTFQSTFIGQSTGYFSTGVTQSFFVGYESGRQSVNLNYSNVFGYQAGYGVTSATYVNFFGNQAGYQATSAQFSNFIGYAAGTSATNAQYSNFIGANAGLQASNASYSTIIGFNAGKFFTSNNIGSNNIIIGTNISLPSGTTNSLNIGGVLFGTGLYSTTGGDPSITANGGKIGINVVNPTNTLDIGGSLLVTGTTSFGNGTFTKAGSATGDVLLDNNSTDTPGVLFYYANNSNYGIDSWSGSFDVLSGQLVRITNKLNETGGAVKMAIDTSGNMVVTGFIKPNAWRAGQVVNDIMLSNTEVTVSTTTIATSNSDTDFVTYSYTPLSSTSYIVIHYHLASFSFEGGTGNDSYFSRIKVDGTEITYSRQSTVNGNRTGVLFPLTGRYTNSNTTAKSIVVACRRDSADDSITIVNSATSMWLRITEIAR